MMDYRENHVRGRDGRLLEVEAVWVAEAERFDGMMVVASAMGATIEEAWAALRTTSRAPLAGCRDSPLQGDGSLGR